MRGKKLKSALPARKLDAHKGDFGHVFILAGAVGLTGAAYLTSQAALLSGSGLVTLGVPKSLNSIMEVKLTEVMTVPLAETPQGTLSLQAFKQIGRLLPEIDVLAIGPGLSRNLQTQQLVRKLLSFVKKPIVLDADGINALIGNLGRLRKLKSKLVLTPHPGELSGLLKLPVGTIQKNRIKTAKEFARKYKVVLVLKGHRTVVADANGSSSVNATGNPGMASGGCGDVLTGIIAAFLAQGLPCFAAAKSAVFIHGLAGDYAAKEQGEVSLIASDLLDKLPQAIMSAG